MNCPKCNKEVSLEWNSCPYCGYKPAKCSNPKCNAGWLLPEAKFCPTCGEPLKSAPASNGNKEPIESQSIMNLFPKLKLAPTSLVRRPRLFWWWVLYIFGFLAILFLMFTGIMLIDEGLWKNNQDITVLGIVLIIISAVLIFLWGKFYYKKILLHPHGGHKKLVKEADYVSGNRGFCIFVKNNCFGLIKLWRGQVFVPPIYDYMEWETLNKYLRVRKDGREFLIDIYNNEV